MIRFSVRRFFIKTMLLFLYFILIPLSSIAAPNQDYKLEEIFHIIECVSGPPSKWEEVYIIGGVVDIKNTIKIEFYKNKVGDRGIKIDAWTRKKGKKPKTPSRYLTIGRVELEPVLMLKILT